MAIKRVILHLGMPKAGSSSIQRALITNSAILKRNGFRYLYEWGESHAIIMHNLFYPHSIISRGSPFHLITEEERQIRIKNDINTMLKIINTTECETLIFSGEIFFALYDEQYCINLQTFLIKYFRNSGIETIIICFIRNPLTRIISARQQLISAGNFNRRDDLYDNKILRIKGSINNVQKYFSNFLILLKFETAVKDKDGLVGYFLKAIGFPEREIFYMDISKVNESRCMEVIELCCYINDKEPYCLYGERGLTNKKRQLWDLNPMWDIKGAKFDFLYQNKVELWERLKEFVKYLKENTGIDYTDYQVPPSSEQETYSEKTIQGFIEAFPKLSPVLQKLFLEFFEKKYKETTQEKFKRLYFEDKSSISQKIYNTLYEENARLTTLLQETIEEKDALLSSLSWRITKPLRKAKKIVKRILGR